MKFGDYIRQKREEAGWTQPEAAAKIDIEQSYLSKLETGKSYPSEDVFNKLVKTFDLNINAMTAAVSSDELNKLREVSLVRTAILSRDYNQRHFMRGWLIAGLVMIMLGGAVAGMTASLMADAKQHYFYRSEGLIYEGEGTNVFELLKYGAAKSDRPLEERINYDYQKFNDYRGQEYIVPVEGGYRHYHHYSSVPQYDFQLIGWYLSITVMLLFGGLASFYIARRWH